VLNSLSALPDSSDETIGAAPDAAYMAARYRASQGSYAAAAAEYGEVFTARLRGLVPDHPDTRKTARQIDFHAEPPSSSSPANTEGGSLQRTDLRDDLVQRRTRAGAGRFAKPR
jgi:hypothetical protein